MEKSVLGYNRIFWFKNYSEKKGEAYAFENSTSLSGAAAYGSSDDCQFGDQSAQGSRG
ncbi:MAG: hypothetical protein LC633_02915 [Desulfobulbaceae bacterium]|nr:hypothetical protein [Desulfobulbaceae bacterium]